MVYRSNIFLWLNLYELFTDIIFVCVASNIFKKGGKTFLYCQKFSLLLFVFWYVIIVNIPDDGTQRSTEISRIRNTKKLKLTSSSKNSDYLLVKKVEQLE